MVWPEDAHRIQRPTKYVFHRTPDVRIEVKNVTFKDAGYYGVGEREDASRNGPGVVFIVKG
jgi:hypothetical protein